MQAFLEYVVKGLVQHPEDVTITPVERACTRRTWGRLLGGRA
jgi:predicted RNA-binding protein YlqC (UPF0109 family)